MTLVQPETTLDWDEDFSKVEHTRHLYCGRKFEKVSKDNPDILIEFTFICDDYRRCNWCRHEKILKEKGFISEGMVKEDCTEIYVTYCNATEVKKLNRKLRNNDKSYREYPQDDGSYVVLHCDKSIESQVTIKDDTDMDKLPFDKWLSSIPDGKRVSSRGKMIASKATIANEETDYVAIWTMAIWTDAPKETRQETWQQAVRVAPIDEIEFQASIGRRMRIYGNLLEDRGYVTYYVPQQIMVQVNDEVAVKKPLRE